MADIKSEYTLEIINKPSQALIDALDIYLRNTSPTVRTPTNEIEYWANTYNKIFQNEKDELMIFAFYKNNIVIGYAQMVYFYRTRLLVVDHIAIEEGFRCGFGAFFELIEQLKRYVSQRKLEVNSVVTEIAYHSDTEEPRQDSRVMIRLLKIVGFSVAKARYTQPLLGMYNYETQTRAVLMFLRQDPAKTIKIETYMDVVHTIYYKHYMRWYAPFPETDQKKYRTHLDRLYSEIESSTTGKIVVLNGTAGFADEGLAPATHRKGKMITRNRVLAVLLLVATMTTTFYLTYLFNFKGTDIAIISGTSIVIVIFIIALFDDKPIKLLERALKRISR